MELGTVRQVDIDQEMQAAYLDYAMSVIVARALPDVRDGLKPVHRRILFAMYDMGLHPSSPYKKSARIVGEVLGKYHPHGDSAVYESMVRMAQDFSMRYVLVDGQGNFGSIDGDSAAAMRYTEARLHAVAEEMLSDINKDTIDFGPNFDGSLNEPLILPSAFPNLIVNGSSGIAVGMATNMPPHNLSEVCDALTYMIDRYDRVDDISVDELMHFIKGPDFPTGGIVYAGEEGDNGNGSGEAEADAAEDHLRAAYASGRGRIVVQAKAHIEEMSRNRNRIVVTELPYQVNKSRLIERIAELVRDGRLEGITDLRDESDRQGMRIIIEVTRNVEPRKMLSDLFRLTPMRSTFSIINLALVDGEPRTLPLRRLMYHFVEHRREVITRRSQFDLARAKERAHILEGLLVALANLDEVIRIIRHSQNVDTAHTNLRKRFKLTDVQAQAILDMMLRRLAALERQKLEAEYKEKLKLIAYLEDILSHPIKILKIIKDELAELKKKYGDARRTQIVRGTHADELITTDLLPDERSVVVLDTNSQVYRQPEQRLLLLGQSNVTPRHVVVASARDTLACLTPDGRAIPIAVHAVPDVDSSPKKALGDLASVTQTDDVGAILALPAREGESARTSGAPGEAPAYLMTLTAAGKIKRTTVEEVSKALARGETGVMNVDPEDRLIWAGFTPGESEVILVSAKGKGIRFNEEEVRASGLGAGGVLSMKLDDDDHLLGAGVIEDGALLLTISANGFGKVSPLKGYPAQKRYGSGIVTAGLNARTGNLVGAAVVGERDEVILVTAHDRAVRARAHDFPAAGRATFGRSVIELQPKETVSHLMALPPNPESSESPKPPAPDKPKRPRKPAGSEPGKTSGRGKKAATAPQRAAKAPAEKSAKPAKPRTAGGSAPKEPQQLALDIDVEPTWTPPVTGAVGARLSEAPRGGRRTKAPPAPAEKPGSGATPAESHAAPPAAKRAARQTPVGATAPKTAKATDDVLDIPTRRRPAAKKTRDTAQPAVKAGVAPAEDDDELELPVTRRVVFKGKPAKPLEPTRRARAKSGEADEVVDLPVKPAAKKRKTPSSAQPAKAKGGAGDDKGAPRGKPPRRISSTKAK